MAAELETEWATIDLGSSQKRRHHRRLEGFGQIEPWETQEDKVKTMAGDIVCVTGRYVVVAESKYNSPYQVTMQRQFFEPVENLEKTFCELASRWKSETAAQSSPVKIAMHPAYQKIIGMGRDALPFIFRELKDNGGDWYWALTAITRESPISKEDAGNISNMRQSWLRYAFEKGYL